MRKIAIILAVCLVGSVVAQKHLADDDFDEEFSEFDIDEEEGRA